MTSVSPLSIALLMFPAIAVLIAAKLGLARGTASCAVCVGIAGLMPAAMLFLSSRNADAITNAAGYVVAPAFGVVGVLTASIATAFARAA